MKKSKKQEIVSRILISSSVFILGSSFVTQTLVSIPAAAETINTSAPKETLAASEQVSEPLERTKEEQAETTTSGLAETAETAETTNKEDSTEYSMESNEKKSLNASISENILWSGMWGSAPATLDSDGMLTVGAGTFNSAVDQIIPLEEVPEGTKIKRVILTAPVILPAGLAGLFQSTSHWGKVPSELVEIVGLPYLDTSQATTMNSMFYSFRGTSLDLSNFDSTGVKAALGAGMNQFLASVRNLKELRLGKNFSFVGWNNFPVNPYPVNLNNPSSMSGFDSRYYTGYWQNVGTGTVDAPNGIHVLLSQDLVLTYDGETMADTYVWQPKKLLGAPVTVNYRNDNDEELLPSSELTGYVGDPYTCYPKEIAGYTLREVQGDETGVFSSTPQTVTYIYTPNLETKEENKEVTRTIHYVYENGTEAAPDKIDSVIFTRIVTTNAATGEVIYGEWEAKDGDTTFNEVKSPVIEKYNADKESVEEVINLTAEDNNSEVTVTYSPNIMNEIETKEVNQTIHYVYEDGTEAAPDKVDSVIFTRIVTTNAATDEVTYGEWEAKDSDTDFAEVVSPEIENYTADKASVPEVTGVTPADNDKEITVLYSPKIETTTETNEVKQTIHYVFEDGTKASDDYVDTVTFTRNAAKNLATGETIYDEWKAKDQDTTFDEVKSPKIDHYTADKEVIAEVTGLTEESRDTEVTVMYTAKSTTASETKKVTRTIHYVYENGKEAAPDKADTVTFVRTVITNDATGEKTYGEWEAKDNDTTFDEVISPTIADYTADKEIVEEMTELSGESNDSEVTIIYKKNPTKPISDANNTEDTIDDSTIDSTTNTIDLPIGTVDSAIDAKDPANRITDPTTKANDPIEPTTKNQEKASEKFSEKVSEKTAKNVTNKKRLPQTGDETHPIALYSGITMLAAVVAGIFINKRSRRKAKQKNNKD